MPIIHLKTKATPGDWNAYSDISGKRYKASEMEEDWQGRKCSEEEVDPRHPQDFVRVKPETFVPPDDMRPEPDTDKFTTASFTDTSTGDPVVTGSFTTDSGVITKG